MSSNKKSWKNFFAISLVFSISFCLLWSFLKPKKYDVPSEFILSETEISQLLYDRGALRKQSETSLPKHIAISLSELREYPLIFAFFPKEKRLILVTQDLYYYPESEKFTVVRNPVERVILMELEVCYRNTKELLMQDFWYGSLIKISPIDGLRDREPMSGAFYVEGSVLVPSDPKAKGNIYGRYYPAKGSIVREFSENPDYPHNSKSKYRGFLVVSEEDFNANQFHEVLRRYEMLPIE